MTTDITMPRLSETMVNGKILSWQKKTGEKINKGDIIAEVETDKANMEIEAIDSGTLSEILVSEGNLAKVGEPIAVLNGKAQAKVEPPKQEAKTKNEPAPKTEEKPPEPKKQIQEKSQEPQKQEQKQVYTVSASQNSSPLAKRLAAQNNINLSNIKGTGPGNRILEKDVMSYINSGKNEVQETNNGKKSEAESQSTMQPLTRMRQTIAQRMTVSKQNIPHFYVTEEIIADALLEYQKALEETTNTKITLNDIFIKTVAMALKKHPLLNSSFKGDSVEIHNRIDIGIAFALPEGLLVPVIHNCYEKSLEEISNQTREIKDKVKNNKLRPDDMMGGTFSISNMGMFNIKEFIAIINPPEAAGLAIGTVRKAPVVKDDNIVIGNVFNITLSADHRVIDGAEAAGFIKDLKSILEDPEQID